MNGQAVRVGWSDEQWARVQEVARSEVERTRLAARFLPAYEGQLSENDRDIKGDVYDPATGTVDDLVRIPLVEIQCGFQLNLQQVQDADLPSALVLVRRAANQLARIEDAIVFHGQPAEHQLPAVVARLPGAGCREGYQHDGLVGAGDPGEPVQREPVPPGYGEAIVAGVNAAMGTLEGRGYSGPYALVFPTGEFTEATRPTPSMVLPKDRIDPLVETGFWRSGVLKADNGVLISIGGNPIDLAVALQPTVRFVNVTGQEETYRFRLVERFALRIKEANAVLRLEFLPVKVAKTVKTAKIVEVDPTTSKVGSRGVAG